MSALFPADATKVYNSVIYNLTNRKPDKGFSRNSEYSVNIFTSRSGHERRSLIARRPKRTFSLTYNNLNGSYTAAIEQFYAARNGTFESFELDLTYLGLSGTVFVRFEGGLTITEVLSTLTENTSFYNISFNLVETYN